MEMLTSLGSGWHPLVSPMPTLIVTVVVETLQRAAALYHILSLADDLLVQSAELMMKWLDMDIEFNEEELGEGSVISA